MTENVAAAVDSGEASPAVARADSTDTAAIDEGLKTQMSEIIVKIVETSGGNLEHPALASKASEHTAEEIAELLKYCKIEVTAVDAEVAAYHMTLDAAKEIARETLTAPSFEAPSDEKPESGDVTKSKGKGRKASTVKKGATTEPKAAKKAVEITEHDVLVVNSADLVLSDGKKGQRAKLVQPWPDKFYLDVAEKKGGSGHQVDPGRSEGYAPVMPNISLLKSSGNPYPTKADDTVQTSPKYEALVAVSHYTYVWLKVMIAKDEEVRASNKDLLAGILSDATVKDSSAARACVTDTLRDLALFGLCKQYRQGRARIFRDK
jgi:hypothetical protein